MTEENRDAEGERHIEVETIDSLPIEEALSLIGEETRANILYELGAARSRNPTSADALSFSELMERVGVEDSGRFNYHLGKLVGPFVKKGDEGYSLRLPGQFVYQAMVAGTLTERRTIEPFSVGDCPNCGGRLSAAYHPDHLLTVGCTGCRTLFDAIHFPARGIEARSKEELLTAAYQRRHHKVAAMRRGVCPGCGAVVERALEPETSMTYGSASVEEMAGLETYAVLECTACRTSLVGHPANIAVTLPSVVGFFAEHGRDAALSRWWNDPIATARAELERREDDPPTVEIPFTFDATRLTVTLDADLEAVRTTRTEK